MESMIDFYLAILRLSTCYLLSKKIKSSWLVIIMTNIAKILMLHSIGLSILASSKFLTLLISFYAWNNWNCDSASLGENDYISLSLKKSSAIIIMLCLCCISLILYSSINKQIIATFLNLTAYYLAASHIKYCWYIWLIYDLFLINIFLEQQMYMNAGTTLLYIPIALYGRYYWQQLDKINQNPILKFETNDLGNKSLKH